MCTLSHHIWTLAWALTDKSEWRLTAVTCRSITTHLGERSAASSAGETSQPQIHMNAHYGCWCKNVYSVLVAVMKAPSEPETETPRWCHLGKKNPSSFPLVVGAERVREKGWGALLVHHALAFGDNSLPGKFHAERSSDNTRRSSGGTLFLHQWAKVGQEKKKKKYTCFQWQYYQRLAFWAAGSFKHDWVQNSLVLIDAWSLLHRNPCWVPTFLGLIHLWLKGKLNTCSWDTHGHTHKHKENC